MYTRKTPMTRLINRLIERTIPLVSARRAPPMGPMQTMLTSPLGQAGIRPLPALAEKPLADAQERRGAIRTSKRFKLSLMAALVGLAIHSGLVAAAPVNAYTQGETVGRDLLKAYPNGGLARLMAEDIEKGCDKEFKPIANGDPKGTCVLVAFLHNCPKNAGNRKWQQECTDISNILSLTYMQVPRYACATKETGDQLCLISPITVSSGDLLPISIDFGDLNGDALDNVMVTVHVSSASGAELSQPYRDPENPGDFDLTWTAGPDGWVGTASLGSISGTVSAQPVFAIGNVPADDSVTITGHVDYTRDGFFESLAVIQIGEVLSEPLATPDAVTPE